MITCDALEWQTNSKVIFFSKIEKKHFKLESNLPLPQNSPGQNHCTISEIVQKSSFLKAPFSFRHSIIRISLGDHQLSPRCERPKLSSQEDTESLSIKILVQTFSLNQLQSGFLGVYSTTQWKKLWIISNWFFWIFIAGASKHICIKYLYNLQHREGISH